MFQGLLNSKAVAGFAGSLLTSYVRFIKRTSDVSQDPPGFLEESLEDIPVIIAMWHGQGSLLPLIRIRDDIRVGIMVARHADGNIAHESLVRFGMDTIRGAGAGRKGRDKGGVRALHASIKALRNGITVAMTADVPTGPARKCGLGIITLAKHSGRPILPVSVVTNHYAKLNTWSGHTINFPFSKMVVAGSEMIRIPKTARRDEMEVYRRKLEESLDEVTARSYTLSGTVERGIPNEKNPAGFGPALRTYVRGTRLLQPAARLLLKYRQWQGKEDPERIGERLGMPSATRKPGPVIWIHAASVGETNAVLQLIERLLEDNPKQQIVLTTGTVTSARLAGKRLPKGAIHQFAPLDTPDYLKRFFDYWKPDTIILTESEIWPNLINEARARKVPLVLVNGRISLRSYRRWRKRFKISRPLFSSLDFVVAQNNRYALFFERLGSKYVLAAGNLKMDAAPPPVDADALKQFRQVIANRPLFLAASTHPGEEEVVLRAHDILSQKIPDLLTVIVPRHPERGGEIEKLVKSRGIACSRRSTGALPDRSQNIHIADTIGELGLFYSVADAAFIGGSLVEHGGQNPVEAVLHECAVLSGPHTHNFDETYEALRESGGTITVHSAEELAEGVSTLLRDESKRDELNGQARETVEAMRGALERTMQAIRPFLPAKSEGKRRAS